MQDDHDDEFGRPLRDDDLARLRSLMPGITDDEIVQLGIPNEDDFGLAYNLVLYSQYVAAVARGSKLVFPEYEAICGYREDLEEGVAVMADGSLRERLLDAIDVIDQQYLACTVSSSTPLRPSRPPANPDWWWWWRKPRRTAQRLRVEEASGIRESRGEPPRAR